MDASKNSTTIGTVGDLATTPVLHLKLTPLNVPPPLSVNVFVMRLLLFDDARPPSSIKELPAAANEPQLPVIPEEDAHTAPTGSCTVHRAVDNGVVTQPTIPVVVKLSDVGGVASELAAVTLTEGAAVVMVDVSTSVAAVGVAPSLVVMVKVVVPALVRVYFTVANVALICAKVPVKVMVAVPLPAMVALPVVAANVPAVTAS